MKIISSKNDVGKLDIHIGKQNKISPYLILYTRINSKLIKDLNVRHETIKLIEENIKEKLPDIDFGSDFLDMSCH